MKSKETIRNPSILMHFAPFSHVFLDFHPHFHTVFHAFDLLKRSLKKGFDVALPKRQERICSSGSGGSCGSFKTASKQLRSCSAAAAAATGGARERRLEGAKLPQVALKGFLGPSLDRFRAGAAGCRCRAMPSSVLEAHL